jgi:Mlc titration factor MtfA (ptsG expression regulator)
MPQEFYLVLVGLVVLPWGGYLVYRWWAARRRMRLKAQILPTQAESLLRRNVPLYKRMPAQLQDELRGYVNIFLAEKIFVGCDGLEVTDEMRVTVAGNACVLLLKRAPDHFDGFRSILLYPTTFAAPLVEYDGEVVTEHFDARSGESWDGGPVILAWSDVLEGIRDPHDGHNVVLHEFAHKLDEENGGVDGLPILREADDYEDWARVFTREFADLVDKAQQHHHAFLDEYGATSPPEFFAVATEAFFERGELMRRRLPDLYLQLQKFYGVDPASWAA